MNKLPFATPLVALVLLAGCKPETVTANGPADPTASQIAAAPKVKLPPAMLASKIYRCKDNSVVYVDWFNDNMTANIRTKKDGEPIHLNAQASGQPYEGGGYTLTGTVTAPSITFKTPSGGGQACDV